LTRENAGGKIRRRQAGSVAKGAGNRHFLGPFCEKALLSLAFGPMAQAAGGHGEQKGGSTEQDKAAAEACRPRERAEQRRPDQEPV
jgi:hypothetical protein